MPKLTIGERLKIQKYASERVAHIVTPRPHRKRTLDEMRKTAKGLYVGDEVGRKAAGLKEPTGGIRPPAHVLADRERRQGLQERTFGDPLPGYSALDKRRA